MSRSRWAKSVRVVMKRHVKTGPLIPGHRTRHIGNLEDGLNAQ